MLQMKEKLTDSYPLFGKPASAGIDAEEPVLTTIRANAPWSFGLAEIWNYRELLYFFVWRDVKVRYKQTVLGGAWAILQPLLTVGLLTVVFGRLAKMPSDGIPYPLFVLAALVPWTCFANGFTNACHSVIASQNLVQKVYFPRVLIPAAGVLSALVDFALGVLLMIVLAAHYGFTPSARSLLLIPFIILMVLVSAGSGFWLAALNVRYRDVRYVLSFLIQFWFFATPIAYSTSVVAKPWRSLFVLNPMAGVAEGFRWALTGSRPLNSTLPFSVAVGLVVFFTGLLYFQREERAFADLV